MTTLDPERALLGALLSGFDDLDTLTVTARDFYQPFHAWVFEAILRVAETGRRPDPMAVMLALPPDQRAKLPSKDAFLIELAGESPVVAQAGWYAELVQEAAKKRRIAIMGERMVQLSTSDRPSDDVVNDAKQWLDSFTDATAGDTTPIGDSLVEVIDIAEKGKQRGVSTPWPDIDDLIRGYHPGRLYVVGARPGVGKSLWASNTAVHLAKQGLAVFVASIEMSALEWTQRCAAAEARVDIGRLEDGKLDEQDWGRLALVQPKIAQLPIFINDRERQTLAGVRAAARRVARKHPLSMIIIDYLQMLMPSDPSHPRHIQVADMSRSCKMLAREFEVPVLALAQLNRQSEQRRGKRPELSDLRESGGIEADADLVILLHVDDEEPQTVEVEVAKGRAVPKGRRTLQMQGQYSRLVSSAREPWTPHRVVDAS